MKRTRTYFYYTGWFFSLILKMFGISRGREKEKRRVIREPRLERLFWLSYRERRMKGWIILWITRHLNYRGFPLNIQKREAGGFPSALESGSFFKQKKSIVVIAFVNKETDLSLFFPVFIRLYSHLSPYYRYFWH